MQPFRVEPLTVEIHRPQIRASIISAAHHGTRISVHAIEMSHAGQIPLATIALTFRVAPSGIFRLTPNTISTVGVIPYGVQSLACHTAEHRQQFLAFEYSSKLVAIVGGVVNLAYCGIRSRQSDKLSLTVGRAGSRLAYHLCLAVAIEVIHEELCVVGTGTYVPSEIDAPQTLASQLIAIQDDITRISVVRVVVGIRRVPL